MNIVLDLTGDLCSESVVCKHTHSHIGRVLGSFSKSVYSWGLMCVLGGHLLELLY